MNKTSMVRRTDDARQARVPLTQSGQAAASNIKHAPLLLPVDSQRAPLGRGACGPGLARSGPSGAPCPSTRCRTRTRGRLGPPQAGPAFAPRPPGWRQSSALAGLAGRCGPPPQGHAPWPFPVLADQLVALQVGATLSYATVRRTRQTIAARRTATCGGGFPQRTMRTWWPPWRRAWLSLSAPRIHGTRWFIGTQSRCHSSRKRARPGPPSLARHRGTRTQTNGAGQPPCWC